jgi:hypothetical protein
VRAHLDSSRQYILDFAALHLFQQHAALAPHATHTLLGTCGGDAAAQETVAWGERGGGERRASGGGRRRWWGRREDVVGGAVCIASPLNSPSVMRPLNVKAVGGCGVSWYSGL